MKPLRGLLLAVLGLGCGQAAAGALSDEIDFHIEPSPLAPALIRFSDQSGIQVVSADASVNRVSSRGVRGRMRAADALRVLLDGTSLSYRVVGEDTIALIAPPATRTLGLQRLMSVAALQVPRIEPEPLSEALLEEVTVMAQKRPQSLQDTALSVSVLDAGQLERRGITGLTDLFSGGIPSLRVASVIGRTSALTIAMRGIHSGDVSQISRDAGVGIYLDGIYLGRSQGLGAELLDVERVEVLRGPQGTLFGRNALGGAVNIISRKPAGEFGLSQTVGVYSNGGRRATVHADLPEWAGVSVAIDASLKQREGLVDNPLEQAWDYGQFRRRGVRAQAAWTPTEDFQALYAFDASTDQSSPYYLHLTGLSGDPDTLAPLFRLEPDPVDRARTGVPLRPSEGNIGGHSLVMSWALADGLALRSINGWRSMEQSQFDNWAGASEAFRPGRMFARASIADVAQRQDSYELHLMGEGQRLEWIAGAYYFDERARDEATEFFSNRFDEGGTSAVVVRANGEGMPVTRASNNRSRSRALFGQASMHLPGTQERLTATLGARYTRDDKRGELTALHGEPAPPQYRYQFSSDRVDPSASLAWQWREDRNLYLRWSTAYRAGGANSRSTSFRTFGPEEVRSWEVGFKGEFLDQRGRLNLAAYDMRYRQLQVSFFMPDNAVNTETVNTDRPASIHGLEADFAFAITPRLRLAGTYAWSDVSIPAQVNPFSGELTRLAPVYSPRHAATAEMDYRLGRLGPGHLLLHADANYATGQFTYNSDLLRSPPTLVVNARATLDAMELASGSLSVSLWARNIFDRAYELAGIGGALGPMAVFGEPRSIGVDATLAFGRQR